MIASVEEGVCFSCGERQSYRAPEHPVWGRERACDGCGEVAVVSTERADAEGWLSLPPWRDRRSAP